MTVKLSKEEYEEFKDWLTSLYGGCPLNEGLAYELSYVGYPIERYIPELESLMLQHLGSYCDDVFDLIQGDIEVG